MKRTLFRVLGPALLVMALLTTACSTVFEEPAQRTDPGRGIARISIGGRIAEGRTLQPNHLALYYALEFTKGEEIVRSFISNDTIGDVELDPGTWSLDVKGYLAEEDFVADPDYPAITGAADGPVVISGGEVTPVTVILTAVQTEDGIGWISFDLRFPDTVDSAVLDVTPLLGAPTTLFQPVDLLDMAYATDNDDGTLSSAGQVDENFGAGFYRLNYTLLISGGTFPRKLVRTMVVHIYDGLASPLVAEYAAEDFAEFRVFTSIPDMASYLTSQPANTKDNPYVIALEGLEFKDSTLSDNPFFYNSDKLGALYNAFQGKYVALDLSACAGNIPDTTSGNANSRGANKRLIVSLILPDSMTTIGAYAFYGCGNMVSVDLPADLTAIGESAFYQCSVLASVDFEESLSLEILGRRSFYGTGISGLVLPASVTTIDLETFYGCVRLLSADISSCQIATFVSDYDVTGVAKSYGIFRECTSLSQVLLPAGLQEIPVYCFTKTALGPTLDLSSFTELTLIDRAAFYEAGSLETVLFPASLKTLGSEVFYGATALTTVDFSACTALSTIDYQTFMNCVNLSSVDLFATAIISLANNLFNGCATLTSVTLPAGITSISNDAFKGSGLSGTLDLSGYSSLGSIGANAFQDCAALTSVILPSSLSSIGNYAFNNSGLSGTLDLSALTKLSTKTINTCAFQNCAALTSVILPANLTSIGSYAFNGSGLSGALDLSALTSLTTISNYAFQNCAALTSVILPASVTSIGNYAFSGSGLSGTLNLSALTNPATIGMRAFQNCEALTSVTLPAKLTSIGGYAFIGSGLNALDMSALTSLTTIGNYAFQNCAALTSVVLPATLTSTGSYTFQNCANLRWVKWPVSGANATVGSYAFNGCNNLAKVELPNKLMTASGSAIGTFAFDGSALQVLIIRTGAAGSGNTDAWPGLGDATNCIPQNTGLKIYVPAASVDNFKATTGASPRFGWSGYALPTNYIYPDSAITSDGNDPSSW